MNFDEKHKKLRRVILLCYDFARQLSYHRTLNKFKIKTTGRFNLNFWRAVNNNAIDLTVLEWCYFFKSHNDDLHWKNNVLDSDSFRNGLLEYLSIDFITWENYRQKITNYRDKGIAHHELMDSINIPDMTLALNATCYYYKYITKMLPDLVMYDNLPSDLMEYYNKSLKQTEKILNIAYNSTVELKEDSYFIF